MLITDTKLLAYLHDATVLEITYNIKNESRSVEMAVVCNAAAGFADWDGRTLCVRLDDVVRFSLSAVGLISGLESVDSWTDRISETLEADILKMQSFGFDCTGIRFGVSFHSGSELEGLCRSISVDVR